MKVQGIGPAVREKSVDAHVAGAPVQEARRPSTEIDPGGLVDSVTSPTEAEPTPKPDFSHFYRLHYESLVRLGFLLTLSEEAARDLVHDVFARIYPRWGGLDDPLPYVRRSLVNASRSWHRRRKLERAHRAEPPPEAALDADELFDVLGHLPAKQRVAIILRFYEQMNDTEIASLLRCRPGTVSSLVHRGCGRLRRAFVESEEEP
jgi:RNA polymerase sigma factor (sigma-70 family)